MIIVYFPVKKIGHFKLYTQMETHFYTQHKPLYLNYHYNYMYYYYYFPLFSSSSSSLFLLLLQLLLRKSCWTFHLNTETSHYWSCWYLTLSCKSNYTSFYLVELKCLFLDLLNDEISFFVANQDSRTR